jgi:hypothetical protein
MADVQHYMTAKLNLADGTIVYPQVSLDNIVAAIDDPTLVTVVTKTGQTISISDIPTAGSVAANDSLHVPTGGAVYTAVNNAYTTLNNAINTKQATLVEGDNIIHIINGSTIMADITNLDVAGIDTTATNGVHLVLDGNTVSAVSDVPYATTADILGGTGGTMVVDEFNAAIHANGTLSKSLEDTFYDYHADYYDASGTFQYSFDDGVLSLSWTQGSSYSRSGFDLPRIRGLYQVVDRTLLILIDVYLDSEDITKLGLRSTSDGNVNTVTGSNYDKSTTEQATWVTLAATFAKVEANKQYGIRFDCTCAPSSNVAFKLRNLRVLDVTGFSAAELIEVTNNQGYIYEPGDGLKMTGPVIALDEAAVADTLKGEGHGAIASDNLRSALSVSQAVDVTCKPNVWQNNSGTVTATVNGAALDDTNFLSEDGILVTATASAIFTIGFEGTGARKFPKYADGLKYLLICDIENTGSSGAVGFATEATWLRSGWVPMSPGQKIRFAVQNSGRTFYIRFTQYSAAGSILLTNLREYEVTALTDDAVMFLANLKDPDDFFRNPDMYSDSAEVDPHPTIKDKYLIKQDMVCPFIQTISMPDDSDLTVGAGLSYKIKYMTDTNPHNVTVDTIPSNGYGWDAHIQMFVKGASSVVFKSPLVLMNPLKSNAGHNLSVKFRNGQAFVYVDDTDAGYVIDALSGTTAGTLYAAITGNTNDYAIFSAELDGNTVNGGVAAFTGDQNHPSINVLGNGTDNTFITGSFTASTSGRPINFQALTVTGSTITDGVNMYDVNLVDTAVVCNRTSPPYPLMDNVVIPAGSTVTYTKANYVGRSLGNIQLDGTFVLNGRYYINWDTSITGTGTLSVKDTSTFSYFNLSTPVTINITGVTITGHSSSGYDVIFNAGYLQTFTLTSCEITGNTAYIYPIGNAGGASPDRRAVMVFNSCYVHDNPCVGNGLTTVWGPGSFSETIITGSTFGDKQGIMGTGAAPATVTLYGYNKLYAINYSNGRFISIQVLEGSTVSVEGSTSANAFHTNASDNISIGDDFTFITADGRTLSIDSVDKFRTLETNGMFYKNDNNIIVSVKATTADPWHATGFCFSGPLSTAAAGTVRLTGTTFTADGVLKDCNKLQLPAGSKNYFTDLTAGRAATDKVLQAAVIVVGNDATAPSGTATIQLDGGTADVTGIGTYIAKNGSNDFASTGSIYQITSGAASGEGTFDYALKTASNTFAMIASTVSVAGSTVEGTATRNIRLLKSDYTPIFGGTFAFGGSISDGGTDYPVADTVLSISGSVITMERGRLVITDGFIGKDMTLFTTMPPDTHTTQIVVVGSMNGAGGVLDRGWRLDDGGPGYRRGADCLYGGTVSISGFTMTGCIHSGSGACVYCQAGTINISNMVFKNSQAYCGIVSTYNKGTINAVNCVFDGNRGSAGQGIGNQSYSDPGPTINVTGCTFSNGYSRYGMGGGLANLKGGTINATNCLFIDNETAQGGQAIWTKSFTASTDQGPATVSISGCTFGVGQDVYMDSDGTSSGVINLSGYNKVWVIGGTNATLNIAANTTLDATDVWNDDGTPIEIVNPGGTQFNSGDNLSLLYNATKGASTSIVGVVQKAAGIGRLRSDGAVVLNSSFPTTPANTAIKFQSCKILLEKPDIEGSQVVYSLSGSGGTNKTITLQDVSVGPYEGTGSRTAALFVIDNTTATVSNTSLAGGCQLLVHKNGVLKLSGTITFIKYSRVANWGSADQIGAVNIAANTLLDFSQSENGNTINMLYCKGTITFGAHTKVKPKGSSTTIELNGGAAGTCTAIYPNGTIE